MSRSKVGSRSSFRSGESRRKVSPSRPTTTTRSAEVVDGRPCPEHRRNSPATMKTSRVATRTPPRRERRRDARSVPRRSRRMRTAAMAEVRISATSPSSSAPVRRSGAVRGRPPNSSSCRCTVRNRSAMTPPKRAVHQHTMRSRVAWRSSVFRTIARHAPATPKSMPYVPKERRMSATAKVRVGAVTNRSGPSRCRESAAKRAPHVAPAHSPARATSIHRPNRCRPGSLVAFIVGAGLRPAGYQGRRSPF